VNVAGGPLAADFVLAGALVHPAVSESPKSATTL